MNPYYNPNAVPGTVPPCVGAGCGAAAPAPVVGDIPRRPDIPSLEEIASYNYMSAAQRQQQKRQLEGLDNSPLRDYADQQNGAAAVPESKTGGAMVRTGDMPQNGLAPITPTTQPPPISADSLQYMNGFLRTQIGRPVQVDFLVGTNMIVTKSGILIAVGANYILINETETDDILACDFYNIKFIRFYY